MPFVHIHWFEGRTDEQKAEIARRVEEALVPTKVAIRPGEALLGEFSDSANDFIIRRAGREPITGRVSLNFFVDRHRLSPTSPAQKVRHLPYRDRL